MAPTWIENFHRTTIGTVLLVCLLPALVNSRGGYKSVLESNSEECSAVKYAYEAKGYERKDVPTGMITGTDSRSYIFDQIQTTGTAMNTATYPLSPGMLFQDFLHFKQFAY